jgi:phenylacetyl-CoA:acceptor oxidoreductase subunit 2
MTSWMGREAWTATLLFPVGLAAAWDVPGATTAAAVLALVFVFCQARLLQAAKGIPAWREMLLVPLVVATGFAEGAGLFLIGALWHGRITPWILIGFGTLVLVRVFVWLGYRRNLANTLAQGAADALDRAGKALQLAGTAVPLALIALLTTGLVPGAHAAWVAAIAGLAAALAGAYAKFTIVTRAGFNQGFALAHLPIRGARAS